jgi:ribosomal protein S18 acetylase RimI-like enzyme
MKRGYKPFVVIRHQNEASKSLYKKLGFNKEFEMARIVFTPDQGETIVKEYEETSHKNDNANRNHVND